MLESRETKTIYIAKIAVLSAMSFVIMLFEFPIPFMPLFLKIDFSEVPILLAAFALGPVSAVLIELIKNLLHLPFSTTLWVGELANFLVGTAFVVPAGILYKKHKGKTGAVVALGAGTMSMGIAASILNYLVFIPLYGIVLHFPIDQVVALGTAANKYVVDLKTLIAFGILPFNLIKGVFVSVIVLLVYKRVSKLLHK